MLFASRMASAAYLARALISTRLASLPSVMKCFLPEAFVDFVDSYFVPLGCGQVDNLACSREHDGHIFERVIAAFAVADGHVG